MPPGIGFSARNAKIRVNNNIVFAGYAWTVSEKNPEVDVTSFEDQGYMTVISTISSAEVNCKGFWNSALNPMVAPSTIRPRTNLTDVRLYLDFAGLVLAWYFPIFYVKTVDCDAEVRDGMKFNFTGMGNGVFYPPGWEVP